MSKTVDENGDTQKSFIPWSDKVIGQGKVDPKTLLENPHNWRVHPKEQRQALANILDEVGMVAPVVVNEPTGRIVDGHLRVQLARERGEPTIPVTFVNLTEDEELFAIATLDKVAELAGTDKAKATKMANKVKARLAAGQETFLDFYEEYIEEIADEAETEAEFAPNPKEGSENYGEHQKDRVAPMRQIMIYCLPEQHAIFKGEIKALAKHFDLENITDTVLSLTGFVYKTIFGEDFVLPEPEVSEVDGEEPATGWTEEVKPEDVVKVPMGEEQTDAETDESPDEDSDRGQVDQREPGGEDPELAF